MIDLKAISMETVNSCDALVKEVQRLEGQLRRSRRDEETWRNSTAFYEELTSNIPDSIFATDKEEVITVLNR